MKAPVFKVVTLPHVIPAIKEGVPLMFDTETDGLYGPVKTAQFYQNHWDSVLIVRDPSLPMLMEILNLTTVIFQNGSYDISTIQRQTNTRYVPDNWEDIFLLGRLHYYTEDSHSLDKLIFYTMGFDPYVAQDLDKKAMQKFNWKKVTNSDFEDLCQYGATDVWYMPQVYEAVEAYREDNNYRLDMQSLHHALDFQNNGMPVDEDRRAAMVEDLKQKIATIDLPEDLNLDSYQQVRKFLGSTESNDLFFAKEILNGNKHAANIRIKKKWSKRLSTLEKRIKTEDGYIYGIFSPSARSGRFTCKQDNLQQLDQQIHSVFGFPEGDGKAITYSDFSQLELRDLCAVIGERTMEKLYREGKDLHKYARDNIATLKNRPDGRAVGKTCNFLLLYYGSAQVLANELISGAFTDEAVIKSGIRFSADEEENLEHNKVIRNMWRNLYPDMKAWQDAGVKAWKKGRPHKTPLGRRYVGKLMTDHLNIEIQGSSADVAKLALHKICKDLPSISEDCKMCNFQHDSYIVEHPNDPKINDQVQQLVGESMQSAWFQMSKRFKIKDLPMPVSVYTGKNWGDIEDNYISKKEFE